MSRLSTPAETPSALGARYGFASVEISDKLARSAPPSLPLSEVGAALEALARILSLGSGLPPGQARLLCGVRGRLRLRLMHPTEFDEGIGAFFDPASSTMSVSGLGAPGRPAGSHLGHEWAHGLDSCLGRELAPTDAALLQGAPVGVARFEGAKSIADASRSAAPYQSILGALAIGQAEKSRATDFYASLAVAQGQQSPLPAFTRLAKSMLPGLARSLRAPQRASRAAESARQERRLVEFATSAALDCLHSDPDVIALRLTEKQTQQAANFCAKALVVRSSGEGVRRRGREDAIDLAKSDIAHMLRGALRLPADSAGLLASAIIHIAPMKARYDDFYAAPYTGRSYWDSPGSLADLSCALVRVCRNQRALSNSRLAKEKFVPMAFWWSMRRQVSEISGDIESRAPELLARLSDAGLLGSEIVEHAKQWGGARGEYKAGALVFSDLIGTGSKMIRQEAGLMGHPIDDKQARALRRKISAPINDLAKRKTIIESVAESFEQFVLHQARLATPLGKACRAALVVSLIDSDPLEAAAGLDPDLSWMHNKDGDAPGNSRRWRSLLRELPSLPAAPTTACARGCHP